MASLTYKIDDTANEIVGVLDGTEMRCVLQNDEGGLKVLAKTIIENKAKMEQINIELYTSNQYLMKFLEEMGFFASNELEASNITDLEEFSIDLSKNIEDRYTLHLGIKASHVLATVKFLPEKVE